MYIYIYIYIYIYTYDAEVISLLLLPELTLGQYDLGNVFFSSYHTWVDRHVSWEIG